MNKILTVCAVCLFLATSFAHLGQYGFIFDLFSHFVLYYCILSVFFIAISLRLRKKLTLFLSLVVLLVNMFSILPVLNTSDIVDVHAAEDHEAVQLKVLHANLLLSNHDHSRLIDLVNKQQPDIISLQEFTPQWQQAVERLKLDYPYFKFRAQSGGFGIALLSRKEMQVEEILFGDDYTPSLLAKIKTKKGIVQLISTHPIIPLTPRWYKSRNQQLYKLVKLFDKDLPHVLIGDLNITRWSPVFKHWQEHAKMKNARDGFGLLATWPTIPLIGLDHCLVSKQIEVSRFARTESIGSDHRPIIVDLSI